MDLGLIIARISLKMEKKKNPKVDLRQYSGLFFNIGLVISLLLSITAFEWKFYDDAGLVDLGNVRDDFEEIMDIPPTEQPVPPPPSIQQPDIIEVANEEEIVQEIEIDLDVEITEEMIVEEVVFDIEEPPAIEVVEEIFTIVEEFPSFPGGWEAFYTFVRDNLKYPNAALRMGIEGKVFVQFVVDKTGNISQVEVVRGIGGGCDEEAVRVLKKCPPWIPGKQRGREVKVRMSLPINFQLLKR